MFVGIQNSNPDTIITVTTLDLNIHENELTCQCNQYYHWIYSTATECFPPALCNEADSHHLTGIYIIYMQTLIVRRVLRGFIYRRTAKNSAKRASIFGYELHTQESNIDHTVTR